MDAISSRAMYGNEIIYIYIRDINIALNSVPMFSSRNHKSRIKKGRRTGRRAKATRLDKNATQWCDKKAGRMKEREEKNSSSRAARGERKKLPRRWCEASMSRPQNRFDITINAFSLYCAVRSVGFLFSRALNHPPQWRNYEQARGCWRAYVLR